MNATPYAGTPEHIRTAGNIIVETSAASAEAPSKPAGPAGSLCCDALVQLPVLDMTDDPEYQAWVESMAQHCRCKDDRPCAGVLAGGLCDDLQDDARDDDETPAERYDREVYGDAWHTPMSL